MRHKTNAFEVVSMFEDAVANYTGAPFVVAVNSCTNALGLALEWKMRQLSPMRKVHHVNIPKRTYVGVATQARRAGFKIYWGEDEWQAIGHYSLGYGVWDCARKFTSNMYIHSQIMCTSHHWSKHLSTEQGGCILHDSPELDDWLRQMRFDGRTEGVPVAEDDIKLLGWHCYMSPSNAALGLTNLMHLPMHNAPLPETGYPDLSAMKVFR